MKPLGRYAALNRYVELGQSMGIDPAYLMRSVGLDPAGLATQDRWIPAASVAKLLELSAQASGHDDFGMRLAELRRLSNLGPLSLVIREEPDVRSALEMLIRYEHTYNEALRIRMTEQNGLATLRIGLELGEPVDDRQSIDLAAGALHQILRSLLGARWQPLTVCFAHPAPTDPGTHRRIFGCNVEFGCEFTGIIFYASDLAAPNEMSDALLRPYARQVLDTLTARQDATIVDRTRELIEALLPTGRCSVEQIARSLGVDRRTVHRRLAESGHTFTSVLNATRAELAERSVAGQRYTLTEIAEQLGFSTPGAFSRWFRSQFGCTPSQWRKQGRPA